MDFNFSISLTGTLGRAQMSGRRHWRVSLGLRTFLSTRVVWLAEWGLSVFSELWRRGEAIPPIGVYLISVNPGEEGEAIPPIGVYLMSVNPGEEGGGHSTDWGLPDFREPWRKGGVDHNPN